MRIDEDAAKAGEDLRRALAELRDLRSGTGRTVMTRKVELLAERLQDALRRCGITA